MKEKADSVKKNFLAANARMRARMRERGFKNTDILYRLRAFFIVFLCLFIFFTPFLHSQDESFLEEAEYLGDQAANNYEEDQTSADASSPPERQRLEMEIRTSTLSELAVWCRTLGLSESGTRSDLAGRLRDYFSLPEPDRNNDRRIITIESAQVTEYFTIGVIDEEYARLQGNVSLSMIDGNTTHKIKADEILFNRTRNIITARGNVAYERHDNNTTETFKGENITVNLDSFASIFLDGSSARELDGDQTTYLFAGSVISRSDDDVTVMTGAKITNANNEEALWSLNASRLWILPGSDFAFLNAVLKVGEIPVLYIPFFYYPGDKLFFNPVLGYRSREGAFIQTTTYILGQPEAEAAQTGSISRILSSSGGAELEREGLFLRSTGRMLSDPNKLSLKILADYYVNLGFYIGLDLSVPKTGILNPLDFSFGLGFTRTVFLIGNLYTPYVTDNDNNFDGSLDWNHSNLFSLPVPFRYRMKLNSSIAGQYAGVSWDFPFYSDPFVNRDLLDRAENMDLISMFQQGASFDSASSAQNEVRAYQWHITSNISPSFRSLSPYISRINISNLSTSLSFNTIRDDYIFSNNAYSPERFFFAPDKYTIYNLSLSVSGTPLSLGGEVKTSAARTEETDDPLRGIGTPVTPWGNNETDNASSDSQTKNNGFYADALVPPVLNQSFSLPGNGNTTFAIDYQITPASSTELQFMSSAWDSYSQVDWSDVQSILTSIGGSGNLNFRLNHTSGLFSNTLTFAGNGTWRHFGYLNEEAFLDADGNVDEKKINNARGQIFGQTNYLSSYAYTGTVRPFYQNPVFGQTNFQYNLRGALVRSKRWTENTSPNGPELEPLWGAWAKDQRTAGQDIAGLTGNRFTANVAANIRDYSQSLSLSVDFPPLDFQLSTNAVFRFWISETNINFRAEKPVLENQESAWKFHPINITETLRFAESGSFSFNIIINPQDNAGVTNITTSISMWNIRLAFSADKSRKYIFDTDKWLQEGEPVLNPRQVSLSYRNSFAETELVKDILLLAVDVNTSLTYDLQRYTNSNFQLTLGFKLRIPKLLELSLSSTSTNVVIWRYFKNIPAMEQHTSMYPQGPQNNIFIDLLDSFNFFDESKRRRSGFNIQKLDLSLIHYLGDWHAEFGVSMYPFRDMAQNNQSFHIATDIRFIVQWRPISEIKSDIAFDGRQRIWEFK
ncbi:MAG: LPS-assembly protein LptD [Treponema sp.]|nr:LPS-assembly protein LptD [Treponema sp.]